MTDDDRTDDDMCTVMTVHDATRYTEDQVALASAVATVIGRAGVLWICEEPEG